MQLYEWRAGAQGAKERSGQWDRREPAGELVSCRLWAESVLVQCPWELSSLDVTSVLVLVMPSFAVCEHRRFSWPAESPLVILAGVVDVLHKDYGKPPRTDRQIFVLWRPSAAHLPCCRCPVCPAVSFKVCSVTPGPHLLKVPHLVAGELAQWFRAQAILSKDPGLIPSTCMAAHNCNSRSRGSKPIHIKKK